MRYIILLLITLEVQARPATRTAVSDCIGDYGSFATEIRWSSGGGLFPYLLKRFKGQSEAQLDECRRAEDTILQVDLKLRTKDQHFLLGLIELSKIGLFLATNPNLDTNSDGLLDYPIGECAPFIPGYALDEIAIAFSLAARSFREAGVDTSWYTRQRAISWGCDYASYYATTTFCNKLNPRVDTVTARERNFMAWLLRSKDLDLGFEECILW